MFLKLNNTIMEPRQTLTLLNCLTLDPLEPIQLAELGMTDSTISVANTTPFATGITTSTGYVKSTEVIFYDSIGSGTLGIGKEVLIVL